MTQHCFSPVVLHQLEDYLPQRIMKDMYMPVRHTA